MVYIQGADRNQVMLLPASVEDYISEANPVRALDAFVDSLDLAKLGFKMASPNPKGGRPRFQSSTLLKLYLWGYFARIRSSRRLEEACTSNLNAIWLTGNLTPDHSTISDFRKTNAKSLKSILRQFNLLCLELKLFGRELVAIDGTFIKAVNSKNRSFTKAKLEKLTAVIERKITEFISQLEQADSSPSPAESTGSIQEKIETLKSKSKNYQELLEKCESSPTGQISLTDPDSRQLKKRGTHLVGYNVQTAVDDKHHLITSCEVTTEPTDHHLLHQMSQQAKDDLQIEPKAPLNVLADTGYHDGAEIAASIADNTATYVQGQKVRPSGDGSISEEDFIFHPESDTYQCPQGKQLPRKKDQHSTRGKGYRVYYKASLCKGCPLLNQCTNGKYRKLKINFHREALDENTRRLKSEPQIYRKRAALAEHPFGTIKNWNGKNDLLCKGLEIAGAETRLSAFTYNFKRVLNLIGSAALLEAIIGRKIPHPA